MGLRMHGDLEKLVKAGKIPAQFAERLDKFSPGKYVMHQDWGVGKVEGWSIPKQAVKINFERKPGYVMGLKLAFNQLTPVPEGHFLIACYDDPKGCREQAEGKDTILPFIASVLEHNLSLREGIDEVLPMQPEDLERFLSGRIIPADQWKLWWEKARAAMRQSPKFRLPTKRGEFIRTRQANSAAEALLADYTDATSLETCVRILDQAHLSEVLRGETSIAARLIAAMEKDIERDHMEPQHVLELIIIRDDIPSKTATNDEMRDTLNAAIAQEGITSLTSLSEKLGAISAEDLVQYIGALSPARQLCVYAAIKEAYPETWQDYLTHLFLLGGSRVTAPVADYILAHGSKESLFAEVLAGISRQSLQPSVLIWICKERNGVAKEIVDKAKMSLGSAIISAIERDSADGAPNRALRLRNMLMEDKELAPDLVTGLTEPEARPFAKAIYDSSMMADLDRNFLLANMMKVHPGLQEIALARSAPKAKQTLYVSLRSFAARKAEYEELVNVKIPKNKHDLEITRAEGDLRENGGYQDAKATRQVLMRRSEELSRLLAQAQPTDFRGVSCSESAMGTSVTFVTDNGQEVVYTILGAWDSDPEAHIVAYSSKLGARLLGHKVGDSLRLPIEIGGEQVKMTVKSIAPAPESLIYPDEPTPEA